MVSYLLCSHLLQHSRLQLQGKWGPKPRFFVVFSSISLSLRRSFALSFCLFLLGQDSQTLDSLLCTCVS
ncbi:hypothetical protein Scep_004166 [Stephania cephalantha]|uniref:Uncharacterized protein n=1 Tax=Stephania cephalantha TaxID=152367 RepID=A0AAP0KTR1_9MAGN